MRTDPPSGESTGRAEGNYRGVANERPERRKPGSSGPTRQGYSAAHVARAKEEG